MTTCIARLVIWRILVSKLGFLEEKKQSGSDHLPSPPLPLISKKKMIRHLLPTTVDFPPGEKKNKRREKTCRFFSLFCFLFFRGGHQKRGREIINYDVARGFFLGNFFGARQLFFHPNVQCDPELVRIL